jgi:hypothetical protein
MRKFKVKFQKTEIALGQGSITIAEEIITADAVDLDREWVSFWKDVPDPIHQGAYKSFLVKAFMRATVFTVEEIVESES